MYNGRNGRQKEGKVVAGMAGGRQGKARKYM